MRILFVQSYTDQSEPLIYPLGLAYLATGLKRHELCGVDLNLEPDPLKALEKAVRAFQPEVMGISLRNIKVARPGKHLSCFESHRAAIQVMRREAPHTPLIAGGTAFSLFAETVMDQIPEIDFGVFGEGELVFQELLHGGIQRPETVKSVYFRRGARWEYTGHGGYPAFREMPPPDRSMFPVARYTHVPTALGVQAKRGCPMQCIHCSDTFLAGNAVRTRLPKDVADEIEGLVRSHGATHIFFCDQLFNVPPKEAKALCQELIDRKVPVKWTAWFNERCVDRELVELCKEAGCYQLSFSPDGVADEMFKRYKKNLKEADLYKVVDVAKAVQIPITYNFMINGPGENWHTLYRLLRFVAVTKWKLRGLFKLHGLFLTNIRLYPHTKLEEMALGEGMIRERNDLLFPTFYNPAPFRWVTDAMLWGLHAAWRVKHWVGARLGPSPPPVVNSLGGESHDQV